MNLTCKFAESDVRTKMTRAACLCLATLIAYAALGTTAEAQTLSATADAYTKAKDGSRNFGKDSTIRVQQWSDITSFVGFDLGQFAKGTSINSANLTLSVNAKNLAGKITVHKVLGDWSESKISHNGRPSLGPVVASLNVGNQDSGDTVTINITSLVRDWLQDPSRNYGLALATSNANVFFQSKESGKAAKLAISGASSGSGGGSTVGGSSGGGTSGSGSSGSGSSGSGSSGSGTSGGGTSVSGSSGSSSSGASQALAPTADAFTKAKAAAINFGNVSTIRVQKWSDITSFVDFNLNQFAPSSSITSAKLNLKVSAVNLSGKITVHKVLSNWSEQSINHNNRPALGPAIATLNVTNQRNGDTVSVDVTSLVREWLQDPAREYGLALSTTEANVWFASKESGAPAELVVYGATTGGGGSTGNVTLSWLPPTENTDGTALTNLKSYRINWTNVGSSQTGSVAINNPGITTYVVENLATGTYRFTIAALNTAGVSSDPSQAVTTSVN